LADGSHILGVRLSADVLVFKKCGACNIRYQLVVIFKQFGDPVMFLFMG